MIELFANSGDPDQTPRTVMGVNFWTDRYVQILQIQIRLLFQQSYRGRHCLPSASFCYIFKLQNQNLYKVRDDNSNIFWFVQFFRMFTIYTTIK